jgi:magnesium transporter
VPTKPEVDGMVRYIKKISQKIGLQPGAVVYIGDPPKEPVSIDIGVIDYDKTEFRQFKTMSVEECFPYRDSQTVTWINVNGIHDVNVVEKLGSHFGIHALVLEDIANTGHRPKFEEGDKYVFLVVKMLSLNNEGQIKSEQVSIVFGSNYVISFQERKGDVFDPLRDRLKKTVPRIKFMGADYLAYAMVDAIVDHYFCILEDLGERIQNMEDELAENPRKEDLSAIHELKRELVYMRRAVWPLREVIGGLDRLESELIHDYTELYIRDLYEHTVQVIDTVETFRDMVAGLLDIYLSSMSNKMNEVMKVLTIIATLFIPLGFLAGVYGMNFNTESSPFNMPELGFKYGYPLFWLLVLLIAGGLIIFFRRKNWL